ncbi:hypothetical protein CDA63_18680 [Hymenobacter amundsenii]|uniref:Radical SAM core domain-containing protein n=1 Tax=Hymenobacter amundsenii TaxID=2006685 RepID=A0A246FGA5_9BACT|nr:radical SAM protein [Hymenobacter amundsenii]OWP61570.1 hypothetical protein CDA63_18680 [Hymenobacter amundsenii]
MKYSQFNSIVPYKDKYLLFNSFTNKYLVIVALLKDLLVAAQQEGLNNLEQVHPPFYQALKDGKYLVPVDEDEVEKIREISKAVDMNESNYKLTINPTMNCNFKCWYCYETHIKNSRMSEDIIRRTNLFISQTAQAESLRYFTLSWFGGEPLLYFDDIVLPIMKHFSKTCAEAGIHGNIGFTTNGYLIQERMAEQFALYNVNNLQITLDGCEEDHDLIRYVSKSKGSYKEIMSNIKLLLRHGIMVTMRINYTLSNLKKCQNIINDINDVSPEQRQYLLVDFHRVWQDKGDDHLNMSQTVFNAFREAGFAVNSHYAPNNVVSSCYADKKNSATINYNGDIFKCTARDFTTNSREGYIADSGEIVWENDSQIRRLNAKFNNKPCLSCRIMPLCNGGCSNMRWITWGRMITVSTPLMKKRKTRSSLVNLNRPFLYELQILSPARIC